MSRRLLAIVVLITVILGAEADSPLPPPKTVSFSSANGRFTAISDPINGTSVVESSSNTPLWHIPGWFRSLYLSDDGEHIAIGYGGLNLIPLNAPDSLEMIAFWERGRKVKSVSLHEIVPDRSIMSRTVSHYCWGSIFRVNEKNQLVVIRNDNQVIFFNMNTGEQE
jgi:hypothetical protein